MNKSIFKKRKYLLVVLIFLFVNIFLVNSIHAQPSVQTFDASLDAKQLNTDINNQSGFWSDLSAKLGQWAWEKSGAVAFWAAVQNAMNSIAYDTATWLASGGKGQKPLFYKEGWGTYLTNIMDNAAGVYIETLDEKMGTTICRPSLGARSMIGLGLVQMTRPTTNCTFSKMKQNWEQELRSQDFLTNFQHMFDPTGSELGGALVLQTGLLGTIDLAKEFESLNRIESKGWIDVTGLIDDEREGPPHWAESRQEYEQRIRANTFAQNTEDHFEDAINVFLNRLAYMLFIRLMESVGKDTPHFTSPYSGSFNFSGAYSYESAPYRGGYNQAQETFKKVVEPNFTVRGDYDILQKLTSCPEPGNASPVNCVITEKFSKAVDQQLTVGQAMRQGYLSREGVFGFESDGLEPDYKEGYPYRSMIILRKFRILPMGWELAAQYLKDNAHSSTVGGTDGARNLEFMVNCYNPDDEYGEPADTQPWCRGLVDPDWVLKAPMNYCKREGAGERIIMSRVSGEDEDSRLSITRDDKYCADETACIKENRDGTCELYGYCTEERRVWDFGGTDCDAKYNTCQTFRSSGGATVSYLENTLDYGTCSVDNVGCMDYCEDFDYASGLFTCGPASGNKLFFDRDAEQCSSGNEGCHQYIRTKSGQGTNLARNASFEDDLNNWTTVGGGTVSVDTPGVAGNNALSVTNGGGGYTGAEAEIDTILTTGDQITVSYYVYSDMVNDAFSGAWLVAFAHNSAGTVLNDPATGDPWMSASVLDAPYSGDNTWKRVTFTFYTPPNTAYIRVQPRVEAVAGTALFDGIMVERGDEASTYADYGERGLAYQRILPDYLESVCYTNPGVDYSLLPDAPAICEQFARKCNEGELGCGLYTSARDRMTVAARAVNDDRCPQECDGYDDYLRSETDWESSGPELFIPFNARFCSANSAGCDEFTNLDEVEAGGEAREYYTRLSRCVKASSATANCDEFYTWEGSSETGYQLRVHTYVVDIDDPTYSYDPDTVEPDQLECNESIYNLPPTDPGYNPDCREYYSATGVVSYHLESVTITCDDNCHPYRRTENNVVKDSLGMNISSADCAALSVRPNDTYYNAGTGECIFCKGGGEWNAEHGACIYMAIPEQGIMCSAGQANCREYSGSSGNNIRQIINNDFEGSTQGWTGVGTTNAVNDSESLVAGGESLRITGGSSAVSRTVGNFVQEGRSYNIRFIAKNYTGGAPAANITSIAFDNGTELAAFTNDPMLPAELGGDWRIYEFNLSVLDHEVDANELFVIQANGDFFIDNVRLTEITDRYYLIRNSWDIPDSCYNDIYGDPAGEWHNAGCTQYRDDEGGINYFRRFSNLCQDSAVGCELVIDTHNYSSPDADGWNDGGDNVCDAADGPDCAAVPANEPAYIVYDSGKSCSSANKGCQYLGEPYSYETFTLHHDTYLKNDPDEYDQILCDEDAVGCDEWQQESGASYFKQPGDQMCEWRRGLGFGFAEGSLGWYKTHVRRCDDGSGADSTVNGEIDAVIGGLGFVPDEPDVCLSSRDCDATGSACESDADCGDFNVCLDGECRYSCILDTNDYYCPTQPSPDKTIGTGGRGGVVDQPTMDASGYWVGLCPAAQSGCSEYIDPISSLSANMVFNGDFFQNSDGTPEADGFSGGTQLTELEPFTLYVMAVEGANDVTLTSSGADFYPLTVDNVFSAWLPSVSVSSGAGNGASLMFYTGADVGGGNLRLDVANSDSRASGNNSVVSIKEAVVSYQLRGELDRSTCNGVVDPGEGCVLFNERYIASGDVGGPVYSGLEFDADNSPDSTGAPADCSLDTCDSNIILNISPTRVCNEWLACKSYVKDQNDVNVCYDIGLCDSLDDNGHCDNFLVSGAAYNQIYPSSVLGADIYNMTGYAKAGYQVTNSLESDQYAIDAMTQRGEVAYVPNGDFEDYGENNYPPGWFVENGNWNTNAFTVINNPVAMQDEGISPNPSGAAFLRYSSEEVNMQPTSEYIEIEPLTNYTLSAFINTINFHSLYDNSVEMYVEIAFLDRSGNVQYTEEAFSVPPSRDWQEYHYNFIADTDITRLMLRLKSRSGAFGDCTDSVLNADQCTGNIYVDNITLRPSLEYRRNMSSLESEYLIQTCRLYPEKNSLGCSYTEDSGIRRKGWYGYCLEHDRYPGDSDTCLLWYPVDKVKGDGIEEGVGYLDKVPLYYSIDFVTIPVTATYDLGMIPPFVTRTIDADQFTYNPDWLTEYAQNSAFISSIRVVGIANNYMTEANSWTDCWDRCGHGCACSGATCTHGRSLYTTATFDDDGMLEGVTYTGCDNSNNCCDPWPPGTITFYVEVPYASQIVQTVTPVGQNTFWSGRAYQGSDFTLPCNLGMGMPLTLCNYLSYAPPFGSIMPPYAAQNSLGILVNPYEWDRFPDIEDYQPLLYEIDPDEDTPSMGQMYTRENIMNLFAESYGNWVWNPLDLRYERVYGADWSVPLYTCPGGVRPAYNQAAPLGDYCAIPPEIDNMDVSITGAGGTIMRRNGFVNLTFNSIIDSQQFPLSMYAVDWGDNERTVVSGFEMRDHPNPESPHSFYHLYSYWDLRAKWSVNQATGNTVYCGDAGSQAVNFDGAGSGYTCGAERCCVVRPAAKIKDNWGWCNNGVDGDPCPVGGYEPYSDWVVVTER